MEGRGADGQKAGSRDGLCQLKRTAKIGRGADGAGPQPAAPARGVSQSQATKRDKAALLGAARQRSSAEQRARPYLEQLGRAAQQSSDVRQGTAEQPSRASLLGRAQHSSAALARARTSVLEQDVWPPGPGGLQVDERAQVSGKPGRAGGVGGGGVVVGGVGGGGGSGWTLLHTAAAHPPCRSSRTHTPRRTCCCS
jgi:hypothetical protein